MRGAFIILNYIIVENRNLNLYFWNIEDDMPVKSNMRLTEMKFQE